VTSAAARSEVISHSGKGSIFHFRVFFLNNLTGRYDLLAKQTISIMKEIGMAGMGMAPEHEAALLRRWTGSHDPAAFAEITRLYAGLVYGTCWRITEDEHAAADATQETFFQLLKHAGRITGSLAGWLHRVATGQAIDLVRSNAARRRREQAYAAMPRETDQWADVSPLVDEALNQLDDSQREVLMRHFFEGQTMTEIAAAQGVSQPTVSRRVEQALDALRGRLKAKGVLVGAALLVATLPKAVMSAPAMVIQELSKMVLTTSCAAGGGAATVALTGMKLKLAAAAVATVVGIGGYLAYQSGHENESSAPSLAAVQPAATEGGLDDKGSGSASSAVQTASAETASPPTAQQGAAPTDPARPPESTLGSRGQGLTSADWSSPDQTFRPASLGGRVGTAPSRTTPHGAISLFADGLRRGDLTRLTECFMPRSDEFARFQRLLQNPQNDEERSIKQCLESLGQPVELVETTSLGNNLQVKWKATVRKPFSLVENGNRKLWEKGDRFELEVRLQKVGDEWRIAGF